MRYLVLSDLHSNWQALEAVIAATTGHYDRALCCGDLVGYGADPNAVVDWVRAHCAAVIRGNHDRAWTTEEELGWFNPVARHAALWTGHALTPENAAYVTALVTGPLLVDGFQVSHGTPYDEDEYLMSADDAALAFEYLETRLAFFGHTHLQGGFVWNHGRVETISPLCQGARPDVMGVDGDCGYLVNPGSVGQPRDGDPRAAYVIYDAATATVEYYRVTYDVATAQRRIREAGLPPILADRLSEGR
ncbi:MAG: metallophosphoesterase family protein [Bryobacteraceae bacterium]